MSTIAQELALAVREHQSGNIARAETLYRQILRVEPAHVDALHLTGLIALQTGSLAAAMHANPVFWTSGTAPASFTATGTTVTDSTNQVSGGTAGGCTSLCTPAAQAAVDVQNWVVDMNNQFPSYTAKVDCTTVAPISCSIYVTWSEKVVAMNQTTGTSAAAQVQSFSVYVKP